MQYTEEVRQQIRSLPFYKGVIQTGSMLPVIKVGEAITVEPHAKNLKRFDIIVFVQNDVLICHYLWNINRVVKPILYQTRSLVGGVDFPITQDDYMGRVVSHRLNLWWKLKIIFFG